jgi:hypothetical protein
MMVEPNGLVEASKPPRIEDLPPVLIASAMRALVGKGRHRVQIILRRMDHLRGRYQSMRASGQLAHRDAAEYSALHWALRELGLIETDVDVDVDVDVDADVGVSE